MALMALMLMAGCASQTASRLAELRLLPALTNHTPFPAQVLVAEDEQGLFLAAVAKVTFKELPDGSLALDENQEPLHQTPRMDGRCPESPVQIDDLVPFRVKAEHYLLPSLRPEGALPTLSLNGGPAFPVVGVGQCAALSGTKCLVLTPYLMDGDVIELATGHSPSQRFTIPKGFIPFVLLRYKSGAMIPTPARADTVFLDPDGRRMTVVYRTTIRGDSPIRVVEFRAVTPDSWCHNCSETPFEDSDKKARWLSSVTEYLRSCPVSEHPGEPCASAEAVPPLDFLRGLLCVRDGGWRQCGLPRPGS